jgi:hypothetical protein
MDETRDRRIATVATAQHGVFTTAHADEAGLTRDQRDKRVRTGRWVLVHPGVYRIAGAPVSWRGMLLADCWASRRLSVASHRSAAELWGLPGGQTDIIEITCDRWKRARPPGLVVHETSLLLPDDTTEVDGIPVTTLDQTLLGLAAVGSPAVVEMALDRALRLGLTTMASLESFVGRKRQRGRNGSAVLGRLVETRDPLAKVPESAMETRMKQLLRRHGLPTPKFQYEIRHHGRFVARVDAAYPELRIALEYDSYEHHTGKLALVRDNDRRNHLTRIDWRTVTFTAADIFGDGGQAIEALRAARRQAGATAFPGSGVVRAS